MAFEKRVGASLVVVVGAGVGRLVEALALDTFQDARGGGGVVTGWIEWSGGWGPFFHAGD